MRSLTGSEHCKTCFCLALPLAFVLMYGQQSRNGVQVYNVWSPQYNYYVDVQEATSFWGSLTFSGLRRISLPTFSFLSFKVVWLTQLGIAVEFVEAQKWVLSRIVPRWCQWFGSKGWSECFKASFKGFVLAFSSFPFTHYLRTWRDDLGLSVWFDCRPVFPPTLPRWFVHISCCDTLSMPWHGCRTFPLW